MFFSLNKSVRKNKTFSFTPRYYDEDKERIEQRRAQIEAELKGTSSLHAGGGGYGLKDRWKRNKKTSNFEKKSNVRLVLIISLLIALCYWIIYY